MNTIDYSAQIRFITTDPSYAHRYNPSPLYSTTGSSGFTYNNPPLKRLRESPFSFLSGDISSELLQQTQDADRLILHHVQQLSDELMDRRRQYLRQALAEVEDSVGKRLTAKYDEIERITKLNSMLEAQISELNAVNQSWRQLAHNNEASAVVLRGNLERVIAAEAVREGASLADDAESSCCGDNIVENKPWRDTIGVAAAVPASAPLRPLRAGGKCVSGV